MKYIVKCTSRENGTVAFIERDGWGGLLLRSDRANATTIDSMPKAIDAWCRASTLADEPRIYQVAEDGTETPLPTYAETLQSSADAKEAAAKLCEALENGEYTFNSKIESALIDIEEALK